MNFLNNNDNLETVISEITDNINNCYVNPIKKVAKKVSKFVFSPKAYGWSAFYGSIFGAVAFTTNHEAELSARLGGSALRAASSVVLGRQVLRAGQLIVKKVKSPVVAYSLAIAAPQLVWAAVVYGSMALIGMKNLTPVMLIDFASAPVCMFPPLYLERNNIELHPFRKITDYFKNKTRTYTRG